MRRKLAWCWLVSCLACSEGPVGAAERTASPPLFSESALTGSSTGAPGQRKKSLGEDCTSGREAACDSSLCLKTGLVLGSGYCCSLPCRSEAECPEAWDCQAAMPGPNGRLCVPPSNWTARAVMVRP